MFGYSALVNKKINIERFTSWHKFKNNEEILQKDKIHVLKNSS